jgi:hypothetical protein
VWRAWGRDVYEEPMYLYLLNSLWMMNSLDALDSPACLVSKQSFTLL